jgi:enoyl-CoA hydratase/carnithine racemase
MTDMPVLVHRDHGVAVLTLNRPDRRNALGVELVNALTSEFKRLEQDADTRVIVLAASEPGFCAGADLKDFAGADVQTRCEQDARTAALARSFPSMAKPIIAAVEGFAMGAGFVLAASCDIVVTAPNTRWQLPEVALGWLPGWGLQALIARLGAVTARRLAMSAELLDGREAHRLGLADHLTADGATTLQAAVGRATQMAQYSPHALASVKRVFAPTVAAPAEAMDAWAGQLLAEDFKQPHAVATLERMGRPR